MHVCTCVPLNATCLCTNGRATCTPNICALMPHSHRDAPRPRHSPDSSVAISESCKVDVTHACTSTSPPHIPATAQVVDIDTVRQTRPLPGTYTACTAYEDRNHSTRRIRATCHLFFNSIQLPRTCGACAGALVHVRPETPSKHPQESRYIQAGASIAGTPSIRVAAAGCAEAMGCDCWCQASARLASFPRPFFLFREFLTNRPYHWTCMHASVADAVPPVASSKSAPTHAQRCCRRHPRGHTWISGTWISGTPAPMRPDQWTSAQQGSDSETCSCGSGAVLNRSLHCACTAAAHLCAHRSCACCPLKRRYGHAWSRCNSALQPWPSLLTVSFSSQAVVAGRWMC